VARPLALARYPGLHKDRVASASLEPHPSNADLLSGQAMARKPLFLA
jgi:hypothetical protein